MDEVEDFGTRVRNVVQALGAAELKEWVEFGEMLLLRRHNRMMEKSRQ